MISMGRLVKYLSITEDAQMQWNTQSGNITPNLKVKVYFTLPALSMINVVTWNFHVDDSIKGRYYMIFRQYPIT